MGVTKLLGKNYKWFGMYFSDGIVNKSVTYLVETRLSKVSHETKVP